MNKSSLFASTSLALALAFASVLPASAADTQNRFAIKGAGIAKCSKFVELYDQRANDTLLFAGWMTGFVTALNQQMPETFDLAPWQSSDVLLLLMRDLCGRNPDQQFFRVAAGLVGLLAPEKLTTLSEIVEAKNGEHKASVPKDVMRRAQQKLKDQGFYKGNPDGSFGSGTQKAFEAFQKQQKITETGVPDQQTLLRLMYQPPKQ
jgi:hypothetical protein